MRRHRPIRVVFLPFVAGCFLTYLFRSINASIAADLSSEFSLNAAELGLLTSAYFLTIGGPVAHRRLVRSLRPAPSPECLAANRGGWCSFVCNGAEFSSPPAWPPVDRPAGRKAK